MKLLIILLAYIAGSFPTGVIIGKRLFDIDIREHGSKNMGGTNARRILGEKAGWTVTFIDVAKVFIPTLIAKLYGGNNLAALAGLFGMLGHCYPIFAEFKGGKGVSSYFAILLVLDIKVFLITLIIWQAIKYISNYVSVASIIATYVAALLYIKFYNFSLTFCILTCCAVFVTYLHHSNIERLLKGTENKIRKK